MVVEQTRVGEATVHANPAERESATHRIALLGDQLTCLSSLGELAGVDTIDQAKLADNGYAAAVLGIALGETSDVTAIRADLNSRIDTCLTLTERVPSLNHLILVVGASESSTQMSRSAKDAVHSICDALSETVQAEVEQRYGSYVIVTVILAGRCNNPRLLAERLVDRAGQTGVADASSVIEWEEITVDSIGDVGLNQYI